MIDAPGSQQEIVEFLIRLKLQEMKQGLAATEQELSDFERKVIQEMTKAGKGIEDFDKKGKALKDSLAASFRAIEGSIKTLTVASMAGFTAIAGAIGIAGHAYGDFQAQVNTLQAVSNSSAAELGMMTDKAMALGAATKYSGKEAIAAQTELARLGFVADEVVVAIDGIVAAAAASGTGLADASELIAGTVRGFGLAAKDAVFVADVLAKGANVTALGFDDLQLSMKYVAPVAAAANQKLTDMVAVLGYLSNNMIKGETAGTAVRGMLAKLEAPSQQAAKYMKDFNFSIEDSNKKIKSLPQMIFELQDSLKGLSDKNKAVVLSELFGLEGLSAAQSLMKASKAELNSLIDEMENAAGSSKAAADIMNKGLNYEMELLKGSVEGVVIAFGEDLEPALTTCIKTIKDLVDWFANLDPGVKATILQVGLFATALLAIGGTGGAAFIFISAIGKAIAEVATLGLTADATAGRLGKLRLAMAGVASGLGVGLLVGGAAALAINSFAALRDQETEEQDQRREESQQGVNALSRFNSFTNKTKGMKDFSRVSPDQMKQAAKDLAAARQEFQNELNKLKAIPEQIKALEEEFEYKRRTGTYDPQMKAQIDALKQQEQSSQAQAAALERRLLNMNASEKRLKEAQAQAAKDKPKPEELDPEKNAKIAQQDAEAKRAATKRVEEFFQKQKTLRETAMQEIEKSTVKQTSLQEQQIVSGQKIAQVAAGQMSKYASGILIQQSNLGKNCLRGVWGTLVEVDKAMGTSLAKAVEFDRAYKAIAGLRKSKDFKETEWDRKSTLPAGAVVVWEKGSSRSGHISVADGQGNEFSDVKRQQMTSHYGGGAARVFLPTGTEMNDAAKLAGIQKAQALVNQQLQEAIVFQSQYKEGSDEWKKAEEGIIDLRKEAGQLGVDLAKAQAKALSDIREEQEKTWKSLAEQAASLHKSIQSVTAGLQKSLEQRGMSPMDKMSDDFDRAVAEQEAEVLKLVMAMDQANLSAEQQADIQERIKGLRQDISDMIMAQDDTINAEKARLDFAYKLYQATEQKADFEEQSYKVLKDELDIRRELIAEEERAFQARKESGRVTPEEELAFNLKISAQKREALEEDLTLAESRAGTEKYSAIEVLKLRNQITDTHRQEKKMVDDYWLSMADQTEAESQARREMLTVTVQGLALISAEFGVIGQGVSNMFKGMASVIPLMDKAAESMKVISAGGEIGTEDVSNLSGLFSNLTGAFKSSVLGEISKQYMFNGEQLTAQIQQNELNLLQLDNQITAARIENKKKLGATASEIYEDEKRLIESQAAAAAKAQDLQIAQLRAKKSGAFGLFQTLEEQAAVGLAEQAKAAETLKINEDKHQRLLDLERQRLAEEERLSKESQERRAGIFVNFVDDARLRELEAAKEAGDVRKQYEVQREIDRAAAEKRFSDRQKEIDAALNSGQISEADYNFYTAKYKGFLQDDYANIDKSLNKGVVQGEKTQNIEEETKARERRTMALKAEAEVLRSQATDDPFDDLLASYNKALADLTEAEATANDKLQGTELAQKLANIGQQRINAEKDYHKQLQDLQKKQQEKYLSDYKDRLQQQKTLIQESLKIDSMEYESLIRVEEAKLKAIQARITAFQEQLEASKRARDASLKPYEAEDGIQSEAWKQARKDFDTNPEAWKGVDALSNVANRQGLDEVTKKTAGRGLREQAELLEMQASAGLKFETMTKEQFAKQMQDAQLLRAKAAELELETEGLTVRRQMELHGEMANAYETYQEMARKAINARYDTTDQRIQQNMDLEQQAANQAQKNIDGWKDKIDTMQLAADEKLKLIDAEILKADQSTRDWAAQWANVSAGIEKARKELEAMQSAKLPALPGGGGSSSSSSSGSTGRYIPTVREQSPTFNVPGAGGQYYKSEADRREAEGIKMAAGGFVPDRSQYSNDRYGPVYLQPKEAVIPFWRWPEILSPVLRMGQESAPVFQALIQGNNIYGEVDLDSMATSAAKEVFREYEANHRLQNGRFGK